MRKLFYKIGLLGTALAFVVVSGGVAVALPSQAAVHARATDVASTTDTHDSSTASSHKPTTTGQANGQAHLVAAQLKSCQNRQKAITNIMARISDRGQKQLTLFGTIATRVEAFYTDKGKTLSNYDALVADVNAKAATAQIAVNATNSAGSGFSCDGTNPKGFVSLFQASLKSEISALQDYRTSVKNLTVGVKSVQGTVTSADNKTTGDN
jgi:hypothetical protein